MAQRRHRAPASVVRVSKALRALGLTGRVTARIVGVSEHTVSCWSRGAGRLGRRVDAAGPPSEEELYEAGRIAARFAFRRGKAST
jgi:hypothetical protein